MVDTLASTLTLRERATASIHRIGEVVRQAGYLTTTGAGMVALLMAYLYLHGTMESLWSNPILDGALFASASVALLLETVGKAMAPLEMNRLEAFLVKVTEPKTPAKHVAPPFDADLTVPAVSL